MVAPTRVLAQQIFGVVNDLTVGTGLRSKLVIGADGVGVEDETIKIGKVLILSTRVLNDRIRKRISTFDWLKPGKKFRLGNGL